MGEARAAASILDAIEHGRGPGVRVATKLGVDPVVDGLLELDLGNLAGKGTAEGNNGRFGKTTLGGRAMGAMLVDFGIIDLIIVTANMGHHLVIVEESGGIGLGNLGRLDLLVGKGKLAGDAAMFALGAIALGKNLFDLGLGLGVGRLQGSQLRCWSIGGRHGRQEGGAARKERGKRKDNVHNSRGLLFVRRAGS